MEKKYWLWLGGAAGAILLFILLAWIWSLGAVASEDIQRVHVEVVQEPVEWKEEFENEWKPLSGARELEMGDRVRTGVDGEAHIRWGDRGVTRLDPETEIVIESAEDGEELFSVLLKFRVESGRVWNRVLKVLDVDGGMQVETSDVVATVRGTAFGLGKDNEKTEVAVTESVVAVPSALVREGQWGAFNASGTLALRQLTDADTWAIENREKDRAFDDLMKRELLERFEKRSNIRAPIWLQRLSERAHLAFVTGNKEDDLAEKYALRHLAMAVLNERQRGAHIEVMRARAETAGTHVDTVANEVHAMATLLSSERYGAREASGELVATLRDLRARIADNSEVQSLYSTAIAIDDRIDDYLFGPSTGESRSKDGREILLQLARFAEDLERRTDLSVPERELLRKKAESMGYRLGFDEFTPESDHTFSDVEALEAENDERATSTDAREEADRGPFTIYQFYATPIKARVNESVRLSLYGVTGDGIAMNVTEEAEFAIADAAPGRLQGSTYFPERPGSVTLLATVADNGEEKTFSTTIEVESETNPDSASVTDVQFEFQAPTQVPCSSSVPFKVVAHYEDGQTKDVTIMSKKSVSDPSLIHVQNNEVLTYCASQEATAEVYATYEEGGDRFTAVGVITIVPDPEPVRGTPQSPQTSQPTTLY